MAKAKKFSTKEKEKVRLLSIIACIGLIIFVSIAVSLANSEAKKTISVCRLKESVGANTLITKDMIEEYPMYYKEFEQAGVQKLSDGSTRQAIVTWDKRDSIIDKRYSAYFLRADIPLYWDNTVKEQSKKNSYLYNMEGELLNIDLDTSDFGDMVVPGDILNIRVSYTDTLYDLPTEEAYKLSVENGSNLTAIQTTVSKKLFNEASVLDMLNSDGESIFDIYYNFISKSKQQQATLLKDDKFLDSVTPKTILLEVTEEEADSFMEIKNKGPQYLITLLPRSGSNAILDSLSDIQKTITKQQEGSKK